MRLFISINFDEKTIIDISKVRDDIQHHAASGRFSRDENLHLTLVFLGEVDESLVPAIRHTMNNISGGPFDLKFSFTGSFKRDGGEIWWIGVDHSSVLQEIQCFLSKSLAEAGFLIEKRKYTPHLTLGRNIRLLTQPQKSITPIEFPVDSISLMKSENINGKTTYTQLYQKKLK